MARTRPSDDRSAQIDRDWQGRTVRTRREYAADSRARRTGGQGLVRISLRRRVFTVVLRRCKVGDAGGEGNARRAADLLCEPRQLRDRQSRPDLHVRVLLRQASWGRSVLPDDHQGQDRSAVRRWQNLPSDRAAQRAREAVLVGNRIRSRYPRADSRSALVESFVADTGPPDERRWFSEYLLWTEGAGGQGV